MITTDAAVDSSADRPIATVSMSTGLFPQLVDEAAREQLSRYVRIETDALAAAEILITGWGSIRLDRATLDNAPNLRLVVHMAGSVKGVVTDEVWRRGIVVTSATSANAIPVAEFTVAMIILAGKGAFQAIRGYRGHRGRGSLTPSGRPLIGNNGRRIGLVGLSTIGRLTAARLAEYDLEVAAYDPYADPVDAAQLGVRLMSLGDLMAYSDIVSLHAPAVPATEHLIDGPMLARLGDGATLINTARGSLIDQQALIAELKTGRIQAILDHTTPEFLPAESELFDLDSVVLTPHLAGSQGNELCRLGAAGVEEIRRWIDGAPLAHDIDPQQLARLA